MGMKGMATPALWMLRWATGVRLYHLFAASLAIAVALVGLAIPFWWLGEHADSAIGVFGVLFALAAYLATATVLLGFAVMAIGRLLVGRIRRTLGLA